MPYTDLVTLPWVEPSLGAQLVQAVRDAAEAAGVNDRTARKWLARSGPKDQKVCWIGPPLRWSWPTAPTIAVCKSSPHSGGCG